MNAELASTLLTRNSARGTRHGRVTYCCILSLVALAAAVSGCSSAYHAVQPTPLAEVVQRSAQYERKGYAIEVGDVISVKFYFNPELDYDVQVRGDGFVSLSLIGDVAAAGHTTQELSNTITTAYQAFLNQPHATVILKSSAGHRVFVTGEVNLPGIFTLQGNETALSALSLAGGLTDRARYQQIVLIRRLPRQPQPMVAVLNLQKALDGSDPLQDTKIYGNDIIYIPRTGSAETNVVLKNLIWGKAPFSQSANATWNGTIK